MSKATELRTRAWIVFAALAAACSGGATDSQTSASNSAGASSPSFASTPAATTSSAAAGTSATPGNPAGNSGRGAPAMSSAGAAGAGAATFSAVYTALFSQTAAPGCFGCHGGMANPALNGAFAMVTNKAAAYSGLVAAMSSDAGMCKGMTRVKAGDPMSSLLYLKIAGSPPCGMEMPPGGMVPAETLVLVKDWIAAGAKDD